MFDDVDDDKLGDPDSDTQSEKLSQVIDNLSNKLDTSLPDNRKNCLLGCSRKYFVKLFLTMDVGNSVDMISLDEAANFLLRKGHEESNVRTQVRRLYATANVLSSLKLIEKTGCIKITDKPAMFQNQFLNLVLQTQVRHKEACIPEVGYGGETKGENGFTVYVIVTVDYY